MKMFRFAALLGIILLLFACGSKNRQMQLDRLEKKRDALTEKIQQLKESIAKKQGRPINGKKPAYVTTVPVERTLFEHFIQVQGTVESDNNILVAFQSPGVVKKIHAVAGMHVRKGQLLAELDASILQSSIAEVENGLALARTVFERRQRLWDKHVGSEIEYLQAKTNKEGLEKKLATLNEQLKLTRIYSPIAGTVDEVLIKEGEMAGAGRGAIRVVQLSRLKIRVDLSEAYIARVQVNDPVQVSIPVAGIELPLKITAVSQVIDPKNRTFQVEISIPKTEKGVKPNMLAVLMINDYTNSAALTVPVNIVQETETDHFLFVAAKENGEWTASKRIVSTGESYGDRVEILSGLKEGEYIVSVGYQNLADGQKLNTTVEN